MKDADLRGLVLQKFYDTRHETDFLQLSALQDIEPANPNIISNICEQLAQHSLITWKPLKGGAGVIGGMGKISAQGVDVIEGTVPPPITITVHDQSVSVKGSTNVQIGNNNTQTLTVEKLIAAVDHSTVSEAEKKEAHSIIEKIINSSLMKTILGTYSAGG